MEVQASAAEDAEASRAALRQQAMQIIGDRVLAERTLVDQRVGGLQAPVREVDELVSLGQSAPQRSKFSHEFAAALLALQGALTDGRSGRMAALRALRQAGDGQDAALVSQLLASLPAGADTEGSCAVLTDPQLRRSFGDQLGAFKAAALAPPRGGLLSHLAAGAAGAVLAKLYALPSAPPSSPVATGSMTEAERNLATLARAAPLVESGDLRGALAALEALTGPCRARAAAWVEEVRHALLVRQAVRAMQAKAQCANAVLV